MITKKKKTIYIVRLLSEMTKHIGKNRPISMNAISNVVFGFANEYSKRKLRRLIEELRKQRGMPICSSQSANGGGYYLASAGSELEEYCLNIRARAMRNLVMEARIRKLTLQEMFGQIKLEMG